MAKGSNVSGDKALLPTSRRSETLGPQGPTKSPTIVELAFASLIPSRVSHLTQHAMKVTKEVESGLRHGVR